ncbi:adenylyl-sulfate kinase [Saccharomonospora sp. CUA-673]|uniref:adenylyl-sulfate kinase n=1 Tax=Saccharomonospora sp. CUA-673 TaxID=1904969 RepID=UPI00095C4E74|nr:adenylyl-sulfate kinase [Saccharomonospora sp. CUA-673]OLT48936.1 adenylyl-sulfate kinase [Saccharomonospora sp. CUA-673]
MTADRSLRLTRGATVWLTGLSGAGKSTVANAVATVVAGDSEDVEVEVLDGDEVRRTISSDLGFSREDRDKQGRRVGFIAELLSRHRVLTLVPVIAPYAETRQAVREHHAERDSAFFEVHVATPLEECARRDPKGLYARAAAGEIKGMTGVDDVYEVPETPELRVDTSAGSPEAAADRILAMLHEHKVLEYTTRTGSENDAENPVSF